MSLKVSIVPPDGAATFPELVLCDSPLVISAHDITMNGIRLIETTPLCQADWQKNFDRRNRTMAFGFSTTRLFVSEYEVGKFMLTHDDELVAKGVAKISIGGAQVFEGRFTDSAVLQWQMGQLFGLSMSLRYEMQLGKRT